MGKVVLEYGVLVMPFSASATSPTQATARTETVASTETVVLTETVGSTTGGNPNPGGQSASLGVVALAVTVPTRVLIMLVLLILWKRRRVEGGGAAVELDAEMTRGVGKAGDMARDTDTVGVQVSVVGTEVWARHPVELPAHHTVRLLADIISTVPAPNYNVDRQQLRREW